MKYVKDKVKEMILELFQLTVFEVRSAYRTRGRKIRQILMFIFAFLVAAGCKEIKIVEEKKFTPSTSWAKKNFGFSASLNGEYVIVGACGDGERISGAAYIFKRDGEKWTQEDKIIAGDGAPKDKFGWSVSIDDKYKYAVVGAWGKDVEERRGLGGAYLFKRTWLGWSEQVALIPPDAAPGDGFGISVSVFDSLILVGAWHDDVRDNNSGSAYLYRFVDGKKR